MSGDRPSPARRRLARILEVSVEDLHGLDAVPDEDLTTLHQQINHSLHARGQAAYARVANLTRTIPSPLAGKLAEKFLPAVIAARVAEQLPPAKARDLVGRVSVRYLSDIAIALDPVSARPIIQEIAPARIGQVAGDLFQRGEYAAMAEFARAVDEEGLLAALDQASPKDLAEILPMLEWSPALDHVLTRLSPAKVDEVITGLTPTQLADLAIAVDLTPLRPILDHISEAAVADVARELFARNEHQAMADLATAIPPTLLSMAIAAGEPADLALVLPLLKTSPELEEALGQLPDDQWAVLVDTLGEDALPVTRR